MFGRLSPSAAIHRQHREFGVAEDDGVDIAQLRPRRRTSPRTGRPPGHGRRGAAAPQRTSSAPWPAMGSTAAPRRRRTRVGRHLLRTGGTHERPQHGPRRVERRRAVHGHLVERGGVEECRPPLRFGGLPGQHRDPSGQHRERGILLDSRAAQGREPPLHGRQLAGLVGRQDQLPSPAGRTGPARSVFNRCSRANAGDPLDSYQSAARRCSLAMTSGSTRRSSPSRNSRNSAW